MCDPKKDMSVYGESAAQQEILRQSGLFTGQRSFDEMMHYVPSMILGLNPNAQTVYINQAVLELIGRNDSSGLLGLRPGELFRCRNSRASAGRCGHSASCQYCGSARAIHICQQGKASVEEWNIMVGEEGEEENLTLRIWANPIQMNDESFMLFAAVNIAEEKRRGFSNASSFTTS